MLVKTSELIGAALDWAVAKCEGNVRLQYDRREGLIIRNILGWTPYRPSVAWVQGGQIIDRLMRQGLRLSGMKCRYESDITSCQASIGSTVVGGPTALIAAMRCYVASKLGAEVEVPEYLL